VRRSAALGNWRGKRKKARRKGFETKRRHGEDETSESQWRMRKLREFSAALVDLLRS